MSTENRYPDLGTYAWKLIKSKGREFSNSNGRAWGGAEDVEQELALDLLQRLPDYDPSRASQDTFSNRVVRHRIASLVEHDRAQKRDSRLCHKSLNDLVKLGEGNWVERNEIYSEDDYFRLTRRRQRTCEERLDLGIDVRSAVKELSKRDQAICRGLGEGRTITTIAEMMGLSRNTIHQHTREIHRFFEDRGLREYL